MSAPTPDAGYRVIIVRTRYQEKTDRALGPGALLAMVRILVSRFQAPQKSHRLTHLLTSPRGSGEAL